MENIYLSRRGFIRLICFALVVVIVLCTLTGINYVEKEKYRWQLEAGYQHYFSELAEALRGISTSLQKSRYTNSSVLASSLANEVTREASAAQSAMSGLPFANIELEKTAKFLSQVGDFAYYLTKKDASGGEISDEEKQNLRELAATAYSLSMSMDELYASVADGSMSVAGALSAESANEAGISGVAAALVELETQFPEYAGLIYDGPFSEHIISRTASFLEGKSEVGAEEAALTAAHAGGFEADEIELIGESAGSLPSYAFSAERGDAVWYFDVTKQGGVLLEMYSSVDVATPVLSAPECAEVAKQWLADFGTDELTESYYYEREGVVTVNFAHVEDDVICYPDLIKVSVAADTGDVIGLEARGYIMNHRERALPEVKIDAETARAALSPELTVEKTQLAVIPTAGEYELLCHEFLCTDSSGQHVMVYVNVETGIEEQILILIESAAGTLSI